VILKEKARWKEHTGGIEFTRRGRMKIYAIEIFRL
jgi:hypothetical protein